MIVTVVGPRSVGKSTNSKVLAQKLGYEYLETDALMDEELKDKGGLDKVTKSGDVEFLMQRGTELVERVLEQKDEIVLDLAGGAISSTKAFKIGACQRIIKAIRGKSIVVGLLPFEDDDESIELLNKRESQRRHFKEMDKDELLEQTKKDYLKVKSKVEEVSSFIVYVGGKTTDTIVDEIRVKLQRP